MNVLIRYLRQGADGVLEVQDSEAAVDVIDIGSAADRTVQLLGRDVARKHAERISELIRKFPGIDRLSQALQSRLLRRVQIERDS